MTKEALQERLTQLNAARNQAMANVNAILGAIEECQHWLQVIEAAKEQEYGDT